MVCAGLGAAGASPGHGDRASCFFEMNATTELGLVVDVAELLGQRGLTTLQLVKERKPEIYRAARALLLHFVPPKKIEELLSLDIRLVLACQAELEADAVIPLYKERCLAQLRSVVTLALDELLDRAKKGSISPIEVCALVDKVELLSGGATARVEHQHSTEDSDFSRLVRQARAGRMVCEAEILPQKRPPERIDDHAKDG